MNQASCRHGKSCAVARRVAASALFLLLSVTVPLEAQNPPPQEAGAPPPRQKIGLVLEGGGALGLAHIGVLQWLYHHHVPVDLVAGTSMGGLVGGIYATGRSPDQLQELIQNVDWDQALSGQLPFRDLSYRRKEDAVQFPTRIEFGLRKGVQLPEGFNAGQQVSFILDHVALPYSQIKSFNDLPTPFACVATELNTGKQHVFHDGSLSLALRATMSLPGIFTPVRDGNNLYADGGLLNNLPVDVAQNMGAQLTVAVYLRTASFNAQQPLSTFSVLGQSLSVMIAANELKSIQMADVLITVPMENYTALDYDKAAEMIRLGYEAAESKSAILSKLAVDDLAWKEYLEQREGRKRETPVPQFIEVAGTTPSLANKIEKRLSPDVGKPVDNINLEHQFTRIAGTGRFASLGYSLTDKDGKPGLLVSVEEKSYSPPIVRPLINIDGTNYNQVLFSAGARITFIDFGTFGSELRNDFVVGSVYRLASEYYHPFTPATRWFVAPQLALNTNKFYFLPRQPNRIAISKAPIWWSARCRVHLRHFGRGPSRLPGGLSTIFTGDRRYDHLPHPIGTGRGHPVSLHSRPGGRSCSAVTGHDRHFPRRMVGLKYRDEETFSISRTSDSFFVSAHAEILRISCRFGGHDLRSRGHRNPSVFFGRRTAALRLRRERAADQSVLSVPSRIHSTAGKAASLPGRQHFSDRHLRSWKDLLSIDRAERAHGWGGGHRDQDSSGSV